MSQAGLAISSSGGGSVIETITGNDGIPEIPIANNFNFLTANSTVKFIGSPATETLDFGLDILLLGSPLSNTSTAQASVGVGLGALGSVTSGVRNVAIGKNSMNLTQGGSQNTAIGNASLQSNITSSDSVAIGYNALNMATGGGNVAVGSGALTSITSNGRCCGIGFNALSSATGVANIAIGHSSGTSYTTSENSNILIGNIGIALESNTTRIGTQGSGTGQQNQCFLAGVTGVTATGSPVSVSSTGQLSDLGFGTSGQVLTSNGASVSPTWQAPSTSYVSGVYGDGSDGAQTFDGTTTILGLVPSSMVYTLTRDIYLASSTINSGVTIITDGYRFFCNGVLTNNGTIQWNGSNGVLNVAGAATTNANTSFCANNTGSAGGAGGVNNGTAGSNQSTSPLALGGRGGSGGNGTGTGMAAGTLSTRTTQLGSVRYLPAMVQGIYFSPSGLMTLLGGSGGGGGGGDAVNAGGGGGSGGGIVLIASHAFAGTGSIQALGGNGGNGAVVGTNCGGGGGGGGGTLLITSSSVSGNAISGQTLSVAGGSGGSPTGLGVIGSGGSSGTIILLAN